MLEHGARPGATQARLFADDPDLHARLDPARLKKVRAATHPGAIFRVRRLAKRIAAMQHCRMTTLALSKRGSLTLPPELRRKMGLDKLRNPLLIVEERDGGLFLHPAAAMPMRDIPKAQIKAWIARDEADLKAFQAAGKSKKK
jgi:hypothetical protein